MQLMGQRHGKRKVRYLLKLLRGMVMPLHSADITAEQHRGEILTTSLALW
jgi:hypothetical protein